MSAVASYLVPISNKTRYADKSQGAEDPQDQQDQQLQFIQPQNTRESLEPNLAPHENPRFTQALASGLLEHRYNQSACGIVDNCFVTWHPSILPLHLEFSFKFPGSDPASRYLAFVLNDKTDHPVCFLHMIPKFHDTHFC